MPKPKSKIKIRRRWKINHTTRIKKSAKRYVRTREKENVCKIIKNAVKKSA